MAKFRDLKGLEAQTELETLTPGKVAKALGEGSEEAEASAPSNLFQAKKTTVLSTADEAKKSDSGAGDGVEKKEKKKKEKKKEKSSTELDETIKAIVDGEEDVVYPTNMTEVIDLDLTPATRVSLLKAWVTKYRQDYLGTSEPIKLPSLVGECDSKEEMLAGIKTVIAEVNAKITTYAELNEECGCEVYNLQKESERLVATNIWLLRLISTSDELAV